jgi:hypothetical protein
MNAMTAMAALHLAHVSASTCNTRLRSLAHPMRRGRTTWPPDQIALDLRVDVVVIACRQLDLARAFEAGAKEVLVASLGAVVDKIGAAPPVIHIHVRLTVVIPCSVTAARAGRAARAEEHEPCAGRDDKVTCFRFINHLITGLRDE